MQQSELSFLNIYLIVSLSQLKTVQCFPIALRIKFNVHEPQNPVWSGLLSPRVVQALCCLSAFTSTSSLGDALPQVFIWLPPLYHYVSAQTSSFRTFLAPLLEVPFAFLQYFANFLSVSPQLVASLICPLLI